MARLPLYSRDRVSRTLSRLASEVVERNKGVENLVVFGIRSRGTALAEVLAERLGTLANQTVVAHPLDVSAYRDDRSRIAPSEAPPALDVNDRDVLLVDDVLYTGRTARAALDAVVHHGRPRSIQLVVLVDRGHREYPIQPDYVGRVLSTQYRERVVVDVEEGFAIYVEE